jgi:hypothetical protein
MMRRLVLRRYCANMAKLSQREVDLREAIAMADVRCDPSLEAHATL